MKKISLYIHIPFCESKCYYCDFISFTNISHRMDDYIKALIGELKLYKEKLREYSIRTIFIGGGTPSQINAKYIYEILEYIYTNFNCSELVEVTMESNPGSLSKDKIKIYRESRINRISMGAQSFDNSLLKIIGRSHSEKDIYKSIYSLREEGFENINLDLISALPDQSMHQHMESLKKAVELEIEHISNYSLILERGTPLFDKYKLGEIQLISDELDREMYHNTVDYLKSNGYLQYEISNYAKEEKESVHNLVYWNVEEYIGLGLGSHSNKDRKRFSNTTNLDKYIELIWKNKLPIEEMEEISRIEEISEYCIMGFRKINGIDKKAFKYRFGEDIEDIYKEEIKKHVNGRLLSNDNENIYLTKKGLDLMNQVEIDFFKI